MSYKFCVLVIFTITTYFMWRRYFMNPLDEISRMGHMKYWFIFGFEWWGAIRPASMKRKDGAVYKPLFLGLWIKNFNERSKKCTALKKNICDFCGRFFDT